MIRARCMLPVAPSACRVLDVSVHNPCSVGVGQRVQVSLDLGGYPVILCDTAGIRASTDVVEAEGIRRAVARTARANIALCVLDVKVRLCAVAHVLHCFPPVPRVR